MSSNRLLSDILYTAREAGACRVFIIADEPPLLEIAGRIHPLSRFLLGRDEVRNLAAALLPDASHSEWRYDDAVLGQLRVYAPLERDTITLSFAGTEEGSLIKPATGQLAHV